MWGRNEEDLPDQGKATGERRTLPQKRCRGGHRSQGFDFGFCFSGRALYYQAGLKLTVQPRLLLPPPPKC